MHTGPLINKRGLWFLFYGIVFFVVINIANNMTGRQSPIIDGFIYMELDDNVPAWYSSMLLAVAGFLSYECFVFAKKKGVASGWLFMLFACLLFFMSCDEIARFHEVLLDKFAKENLGLATKSFAQHSARVWAGGPIVIVIFAAFTFLLKRILCHVPGSMLYMVLGFMLIIFGGVVLESIINFLNHNELQWLWEIDVLVEESLEMIGTILIAYSLILWRDGIAKSEVKA